MSIYLHEDVHDLVLELDGHRVKLAKEFESVNVSRSGFALGLEIHAERYDEYAYNIEEAIKRGIFIEVDE